MHADTGVSLLRTEEELETARRAYERPTAVGRYALVGLGALTLGSGVGLVLAHYATIAFAILAFGLVLMILGALQHLFYVQGKAHWPDQLTLLDGGVEVVLHNGDVRAFEWTDPKIDFEIHVRRSKRDDGEDARLFWHMDRKVPPCPLSAEGFDRIRTEALRRNLSYQEFRRGRGRRELRVYLFAAQEVPKLKNAADWAPKAPDSPGSGS